MGNYCWKTLPCKDSYENYIKNAFKEKNIKVIKDIPNEKINDIFINCFESIEDKYPINTISLIQLCLYQNWYEALKILIKKGASLKITNKKLFNKETTL